MAKATDKTKDKTIEKTIDKTKNKTSALDSALDALLDEAASMADTELGEMQSEPEEAVTFSKGHEKKMQALFRRERHKMVRKKYAKYAQIAACLLLVFLLGTVAAISGVDAWRVKFLNFIFETEQPNSDYNFSDEGKIGYSYADDDVTLGYIPMGFELKKHSATPSTLSLMFFDDSGKYFNVGISGLESGSSIDTEDGSAEKIKINNFNAVYLSNANINSVIWSDDVHVLRISGNIPKEEIMQIAKKIEK